MIMDNAWVGMPRVQRLTRVHANGRRLTNEYQNGIGVEKDFVGDVIEPCVRSVVLPVVGKTTIPVVRTRRKRGIHS